MLTSLQNIVLNEGLNDNGMYDILHVFVKFLGTQHCDKNVCLCIIHVFVKSFVVNILQITEIMACMISYMFLSKYCPQ